MAAAPRVLLILAMLLPPSGVGADPSNPVTGRAKHVVLKSGRILTGSITRRESHGGRPFAVVATDFGEVSVPQVEVTQERDRPDARGTFLAAEVRLLRIEGPVRRQRGAHGEWVAIWDHATYAGEDRPIPSVQPGDRLKTGPGGSIDLLLHKDVWVRMLAESEIEIPATPGGASLALLRGTTVHDMRGLPRGEAFRVRTPTAVLGVKGTRFLATLAGQDEAAAVLEGVVEVTGRGDVVAGSEGRWTAGSPLALAPLRSETRAELERAQPGARPLDDMVYVPAGAYPIGSVPLPGDGGDPARGSRFVLGYAASGVVEVGAFLIDRHEVTVGDHARFLAAAASERAAVPVPKHAERGPAAAPSTLAEAHAAWLGKQLPTAVQWEVAARGAAGQTFPWGKEPLRTALVSGVWSGLGQTENDPVRWHAPDAFPEVDAPTLDVSPFGVVGLVSSRPEWVRRGLEREALWPLLTPELKYKHDVLGHPSYARGIRGSTLALDPVVGSSDVGWRCVVELSAR